MDRKKQGHYRVHYVILETILCLIEIASLIHFYYLFQCKSYLDDLASLHVPTWQNWGKLQVKLEFSIQNWGKLQVKLEFCHVGRKLKTKR